MTNHRDSGHFSTNQTGELWPLHAPVQEIRSRGIQLFHEQPISAGLIYVSLNQASKFRLGIVNFC